MPVTRFPFRVTGAVDVADARPTTPRGPALLSLIDVQYSYPRGPLVLKGATAHCLPGRIYCVVGANGSGKTTLMRIAGGLARPTGGVVTRAVTGPGTTAMLTRVVIGDATGDGSLNRRGRVTSAWSEAVIESLSVRPIASLPREQLSTGQRHRLALAESFVPRPDMLLLDDPFTNLDAVSRAGLLDLLDRLRSHGASILLTTDDVVLACRVADQVAILADGVLAWDHPDDVLLDERRARSAGLRPAPGHAAPPTPTRQYPTSTTRSHASRLAGVVRDRLGLDHHAHVRLQQTRTTSHDSRLPTTVVSVDQPKARTWLFQCPLCELAPHELAKALLVDPEGHTHVSNH